MIAWLTSTPAERRLIPSSGIRGPVPLLIAIMTFVMVLIAAAALALSNVAGAVRAEIEYGYTIQIADGGAVAGQALAAARQAKGVRKAEAMPEADIRRTLEQWLGPAARDADLPLPVILSVDMQSGASPADLAQRLSKVAPGARLIANSDSLAPMLQSLRYLVAIAAGMVLLIALAGAAAIVLATRATLENHKATIRVIHGVGATDRQIASLFQRQILIDTLVGGTVGLLAAGLVLALIIAGTSYGLAFTSRSPLGAADVALLALLPVVGAVGATLVARRAIFRTLGGWL